MDVWKDLGRYMDEWMDGWMDGWMKLDGWKGRKEMFSLMTLAFNLQLYYG